MFKSLEKQFLDVCHLLIELQNGLFFLTLSDFSDRQKKLQISFQIGTGWTNFILWLLLQTTQFIASYVRTFFNKISCICTKERNESIWRQIKQPRYRSRKLNDRNYEFKPVSYVPACQHGGSFLSLKASQNLLSVVIFELKWDNPKWLENYRQLVKLVDQKIRRVETWRSVERKKAWYSPKNSCQISHTRIWHVHILMKTFYTQVIAIYDADYDSDL